MKTYEKLLITAERLMNKQGINGFTDSQLIREAEVSNSGAINYYFSDRVDIFKHVCKYRVSVVSKYRSELAKFIDMSDNVTTHHYISLLIVPIVYTSYRTRPNSYYAGILMHYYLATDNILWEVMDDSCVDTVKMVLSKLKKVVGDNGSGSEDIDFQIQVLMRMLLSAMGLVEKRIRESNHEVEYKHVLGEIWEVIDRVSCGISKGDKWCRDAFINTNLKIAENLKEINFSKRVII